MSRPLSFARSRSRNRSANRLIVLSLASVALMVLDGRYAAVQQMKAYLSASLKPLQWLADKPVELYEYGSTFMHTQQSLIAANRDLSAQNLRLAVMLRQSAAAQRELAELKRLNGLKTEALGGGTAAQIVSNGKNPLSDKLLLNKGGSNGLRPGDAVVDNNGLIGQLTAVHPFVSELTVLTNAQSVVPVMVERTGMRSLLYGDGSGVVLRYFPVDADLQAGDLLVTSGLDSVYPAGIPVARVDQAERSSGTPYYRTTLSLPAALHSSKYVLVLPQTEPPPVQTASEAAPATPQRP